MESKTDKSEKEIEFPRQSAQGDLSSIVETNPPKEAVLEADQKRTNASSGSLNFQYLQNLADTNNVPNDLCSQNISIEIVDENSGLTCSRFNKIDESEFKVNLAKTIELQSDSLQELEDAAHSNSAMETIFKFRIWAEQLQNDSAKDKFVQLAREQVAGLKADSNLGSWKTAEENASEKMDQSHSDEWSNPKKHLPNMDSGNIYLVDNSNTSLRSINDHQKESRNTNTNSELLDSKKHHTQNEYNLALLPKTSQAWDVELHNFSRRLENALRYTPQKEDYARELLKTDLTTREYLDAALSYAYALHARSLSKGDFALNIAPKMASWAAHTKLKPKRPDELDANSIHQTFADSCPLISSIVALASTKGGRKALCQMVVENSDGSFDVSFATNQTSPIHVNSLTAGEKMIGAVSNQGFLLPAVLEKAFGQLLNSSQPIDKRTIVDSEGCKFCNDSYDKGIRVLTGSDVKIIGTWKSGNLGALISDQKPFEEELNSVKGTEAIVLAGIKSKPEDRTLLNLRNNHAYSVVSFDQGGLTICDPLVAGSRQKLTWKQFNNNFNMLMVEHKAHQR